MRIESIRGIWSQRNAVASNRLVLVGVVHAWRDRKRLLVAVFDMDDSSSTIRFANVAHSRLRTLRDYRLGRTDLARIDPLALAHGENSSDFRVAHDLTGILQIWPICC
jgi:hypothetical protein